jgi:hypothetical protein
MMNIQEELGKQFQHPSQGHGEHAKAPLCSEWVDKSVELLKLDSLPNYSEGVPSFSTMNNHRGEGGSAREREERKKRVVKYLLVMYSVYTYLLSNSLSNCLSLRHLY